MPSYSSRRLASHAAFAAPGPEPEVRGDDAAQVEARRQQGVHDGELVIRFILGVGVDDDPALDEPVTTVQLSELFTSPGRDLVMYHLMYGKRQTQAVSYAELDEKVAPAMPDVRDVD